MAPVIKNRETQNDQFESLLVGEAEFRWFHPEGNRGMTVAELIELLKAYPQDLPVVYRKYSEQCVLEPKDISIKSLCVERDDGWVANARPDMPTAEYLVLPGN